MTTTVHMEKSARMIAALAAVFCAASLSAATYTVANGESLTLDASTNNKAGNQITLEDGATLVAPVSGDGYRIDANVYVAGAARIDLASTPTSAFYLRIAGGLAANDDSCSLTIGGGRTEVFFGLQNVDRWPNADIAADGTGISYPIINLKNLYFDATSRGTFHLRANSACTVIQLPTTCDFKFDTGVTLALTAEGSSDVIAAAKVPSTYIGGTNVLILADSITSGATYSLYTSPELTPDDVAWFNDALLLDNATLSGETATTISAGTAVGGNQGGGPGGQPGRPRRRAPREAVNTFSW